MYINLALLYCVLTLYQFYSYYLFCYQLTDTEAYLQTARPLVSAHDVVDSKGKGDIMQCQLETVDRWIDVDLNSNGYHRLIHLARLLGT